MERKPEILAAQILQIELRLPNVVIFITIMTNNGTCVNYQNCFHTLIIYLRRKQS